MNETPRIRTVLDVHPLTPPPRRFAAGTVPHRVCADAALRGDALAVLWSRVRSHVPDADNTDIALWLAAGALAAVVGPPPFTVAVTAAGNTTALTLSDEQPTESRVLHAVADRTATDEPAGAVLITLADIDTLPGPSAVHCVAEAGPTSLRLRWWVTVPACAPDTADRLVAAVNRIAESGPDSDPPLPLARTADDEVRVAGHRISPALIDEVVAAECGGAVEVHRSDTGLSVDVVFGDHEANVADLTEAVRTQLTTGHEPNAWRLHARSSTTLGRRDLLSRIWREELRTATVADHDTFFGLGGDSLSAMRVTRRIRDELGVDLDLAHALSLFTESDFETVADDLTTRTATRPSGGSLPMVIPDPHARFEPFPLTDQQQAYAIGRADHFSSGSIACHTYMEFDTAEPSGNTAPFDAGRFARAWERLVDRHDALRLTIDPDSLTQRVVPASPRPPVIVEDLRDLPTDRVPHALEAIRERLSHRVADLTDPPLYDVVVVRLPEGHHRVCIGLDGLVADLAGTGILYRELGQLYEDPDGHLPPLDLTFRDYVLAERRAVETPEHERSRRYWWDRLDRFSGPPELPLAIAPESLTSPRFVPRASVVEADVWTRVCALAAQRGVTSSGVTAACYAEALASWSATSRFAINVPCFNRLPLHPDIGRAVGEFASLILVEVDASRREPFEKFASRIQHQMWSDLDHPHVTGVEVLRELVRRRRGFGRATMPFVFTSTTALVGDQSRLLNNSLERVFRVAQTPQVWIDLILEQSDGALLVNWDSVEGLFPARMMDAMAAAFERRLRGLADPAAWGAAAFDPRPADQIAMHDAAGGPTMAVPDRPAHRRFFDHATQFPHHVALITADAVVSYGDLADSALRYGSVLRDHGVGPDVPVAVVAEPGKERIAAVFGVLAAAGTYVPLDSHAPASRIDSILDRVGAQVVLVDRHHVDASWLTGRTAIVLGDGIPAELGTASFAPVPVDGDRLAYVLFTSGSTGVPKGVMVSHRSVVNCVEATIEIFGTGHGHRFLAVSALHHDMSVFDLFGVLGSGATLVLPDTTDRRDAQAWATAVRQHRVTGWVSVPTMMEMLLEQAAPEELGSLRTVILGGDRVHPPMVQRLLDATPDVHVRSIGGPTETTVWNIWHRISRSDTEAPTIPYGRAIRNTRYRVLDERMRDRPDHAVGEMYCSGVSLARGYWADPVRTEQAFVLHPDTGERLYRTGDLGSMRPDGSIEFVGRTDFQIKVRGHRIEAGEVESALLEHPSVSACVVTGIPYADRPGDRALAAYVVARSGSGIDSEEIRDAVRNRCPSHMVPSVVMEVNALPLNANGKLDRSALAVPEIVMDDHSEPARGRLETALVRLWTRALALTETAGRDADFFLLGGDSLVAARLAARIRTELPGVEISLRDMFTHPSVAALARLANDRCGDAALLDTVASVWLEIDNLDDTELRGRLTSTGTAGGGTPMIRDTAAASYPLTAVQRALLAGREPSFELGGVSTHTYAEFEGHFDIDRLRRALALVIARHDALRLVIDDRRSTQQVTTEPGPMPLRVVDARDLPADDVAGLIDEVRREFSHLIRPADASPPFGVTLVRLDETASLMCLDVDGLTLDLQSVLLLQREIIRAYDATGAVSESSDAPERVSAPTPGVLETSRAVDERWKTEEAKAVAYWSEAMPKLPPPPRFPLRTRPSEVGIPRFHTRSRHIDAHMWEEMKATARAHRLTPTALWGAILSEVVAARTRGNRFTITVPCTRRVPLHPDMNRMMGPFSTFVPVGIDWSSGSFHDRAGALQRTLWRSVAHHAGAGPELVADLARMHGAGGRALLPVVFTSTLGLPLPDDGPGLGRPLYTASQTAQIYLDVRLFDDDGGVRLDVDTVDNLLGHDDARALVDDLVDTARRTLDEPALWDRHASLSTAHSVWRPCIRPAAALDTVLIECIESVTGLFPLGIGDTIADLGVGLERADTIAAAITTALPGTHVGRRDVLGAETIAKLSALLRTRTPHIDTVAELSLKAARLVTVSPAGARPVEGHHARS